MRVWYIASPASFIAVTDEALAPMMDASAAAVSRTGMLIILVLGFGGWWRLGSGL